MEYKKELSRLKELSSEEKLLAILGIIAGVGAGVGVAVATLATQVANSGVHIAEAVSITLGLGK